MSFRFIACGMLIAGLTGCASCQTDGSSDLANDIEQDGYLSVATLASSQQCNTQQPTPKLSYFANAEQMPASLHSLFSNAHEGEKGVLVLVEGGQRPTGGYAFDVLRLATLKDDTLTITGEWQQPPAGSMVTMATTAPCVLLEVSTGAFTRIELHDADGQLQAAYNHNDRNIANPDMPPKTEFSQ